MNKIEKIGLYNYRDYLEEEFTIDGNTLVFVGENGIGKTVLMTALFPTLYTMDLDGAINMGGKKARDKKDTVRDNTYIYGKFNLGIGPVTLVTYFHSNSTSVDFEGFVLYTHDVVFKGDDNKVLDINSFKKKNKDFIHRYMKTQKDYQNWVAKHVFGISKNRFSAFLRTLFTIENPSMSFGQGAFDIERVYQNIRNTFPSIADDEELSGLIDTYIGTMTDAFKEEEKLNRKKRLLNAIAVKRMEICSKNKKYEKQIENTQKAMSKSLIDEQFKLENLEEAIESLRERLAEKNLEIEKNESDKNFTQNRLNEVKNQLKDLDIEAKIELKKEQLRNVQQQLNGTIQQKDKEEERLIRIEKQLEQVTTSLDNNRKNLSEIEDVKLPFNINEWNEIKRQADENQRMLAAKDKLLQEQSYKTEKLNELKENEKLLIDKLNYLLDKKNEEERFYFERLGLEHSENESIEEYKQKALTTYTEEKSLLLQQAKTLVETNRELEKELNALSVSNKPTTHFIAKDATSLFELVDFKESIPEDERRMIENTLKESGLLELIIKAENIEKGAYLCLKN